MLEAVLWIQKTKAAEVIASCVDNLSKAEFLAFFYVVHVRWMLACRADSERIDKAEADYIKKNGEPTSKRAIAAFDKFERSLYECSPEQKYRHSDSPGILGDSAKRCAECQLFFVHSGTHARKYCSDVCRRKSSSKQTRKASLTVSCQQCGESFATSRADAKFCSARCRVAYSRR